MPRSFSIAMTPTRDEGTSLSPVARSSDSIASAAASAAVFLARDDHGALRLDAEAVTVRVRDKQILAATTVSLQPGELVAIIGESGAGKSTLIKALAGVTPPSSGRITVNGEPLANRLTDI